MSNIEFYRKRAKQFLRWHQERHWPVATQIRDALPAYAHQTDREILDGEFKLADAQRLVAAKAGFESWQALRDGVETSSAQAPSSLPTRLLQAKPCLWVRDVGRSLDFFADQLEFSIDFAYGEPPFYAEVEKDGVRFALRLVDPELVDMARDQRRRDDVCNAFVVVELAKPLFQRYLSNDVPFYQKLRTEPWGARSFIVEDPDGNLLGFADYGSQAEMAAD